MKIDDPKVQAYIKGEMSSNEEREFQAELAEFPEVADLAETLKRTAALMDHDRSTGQKPYGLDLTKATAKKLFDDDEEPEAPWARFFHSIMGKSWRFGVALLAGICVVFVFAFIVVPFVRSLQMPADSPQAPAALKELEQKAESNNKSSSAMQNRNIPTHTTSHRKVNRNMAEAFSKALDPSSSVVSAESVEVLSDFAKVSSRAGASMDSGVYQLPASYETDLQTTIRQEIVDQSSWNQKAVQPDAFANSFFNEKSGHEGSQPLIRAEWRPSDWDNREILLMIDIQAPRARPALAPTDLQVLVFAADESSLIGGVRGILGEQVEVTGVSQNFSSHLDQRLEQATRNQQKMVVLADDTLSVEQADYLLLMTERFPHLQFVFLSLIPHVDENHLKIRSQLLGQKRGEFFPAASPTQLSRSLRAALQSADSVYRDFRWNMEFDRRYVSHSELVGQVASNANWQSVTPSHWLKANDRTVVFFLLRLNKVSPDSTLGTVRASWRQGQVTKSQSSSVDLIRKNADVLIPESTYRFASATIHVGLMLRGEVPMSKVVLKGIYEELTLTPVEIPLKEQKQEFLKLVSTLLAL